MFGNFANGYDNALFNALQILTTWQDYFGHPTGSTLGLLGASANIGLESGVLIAPFFVDRFGRRWAVVIGAVMMIVGAALQVASNSEAFFLGGRILLGHGNAWTNNADAVMCMELAYPSQRAPISGSYNSVSNIGGIIAAFVTFGTYYIPGSSNWQWRLPLIFQVLPCIFQATLPFLGPESPRWLMQRGRNEEAFAILVKYHGGGDDKDPMVLYEYEEMLRIVEEDRINKQTWGYPALFNTPGMRRRTFTMMTLAMCGQMSGNGLISFYLSSVLTTIGITAKPTQLGINIGLSVVNFTFGFTGGFNSDRFGRRTIFLTSTTGIFFCFIAVTAGSAMYVQTQTQAAGNVVIAFICECEGVPR